MALSAFAADVGIDRQRLWRWRRRLGAGAAVAVFEEIVPISSPPLPSEPAPSIEACRFEIVLRSGRIVRVPAIFDAGSLGRLLAVVDQEATC